MTREQAQKLMEYFDNNYIILIKDTAYVDSEVYEITEEYGEYFYSSEETFSSMPLSEVPLDEVTVAMPIDWVEAKIYYIDVDEIKDKMIKRM